MNNLENKPLKDYTDRELTKEIIQRIENCSLSTNQLITLMLTVGLQHIKWYNSEKSEEIITNLKFKYNFLTNQLWKLHDEYAYQIEESNHFRTQQENSSEVWQLSEKESLFFTFATPNLRVGYQKEQVVYQKTLTLPPSGEITFEITEQDRITNEKK